jgi:hypothetical protein
VEAIGRLSIDEPELNRSFNAPQDSSEDDLGMAFSPGKMVDDIVGESNGESDKYRKADEEEITFSGRATRKQLYGLYC